MRSVKDRRRWVSHCERQTRAAGREIAEQLMPDGTLLLEGDLGAGKTVLVRGVAEALGLEPKEIQSPTFILAREHRDEMGCTILLHLDLYRLSPHEVDAAGLDEMMSEPGLKVVEWAERLSYRPPGSTTLRLIIRDDDSREILEMRSQARTCS